MDEIVHNSSISILEEYFRTVNVCTFCLQWLQNFFIAFSQGHSIMCSGHCTHLRTCFFVRRLSSYSRLLWILRQSGKRFWLLWMQLPCRYSQLFIRVTLILRMSVFLIVPIVIVDSRLLYVIIFDLQGSPSSGCTGIPEPDFSKLLERAKKEEVGCNFATGYKRIVSLTFLFQRTQKCSMIIFL